jgi:hypothetical protein
MLCGVLVILLVLYLGWRYLPQILLTLFILWVIGAYL